MRTWDMSGLSWSGHNIFGDRDSIEAVRKAINAEAIVADIRQRLYCTEIALAATRETLEALKETN